MIFIRKISEIPEKSKLTQEISKKRDLWDFPENTALIPHFSKNIIILGENVALFGEVDLENENRGNLTEVSIEEILELHQQVTARKDELERRKTRAMRERGLVPHQDVPDDLYF